MNTFKNNCAVNNKPERKRKNLIRLGVEQEMAYQWSRSRMGGWAITKIGDGWFYYLLKYASDDEVTFLGRK